MEPKETFNRTTKSNIYSFGCIALQESQMDTDHQVLSGKPPWSEIREDMAVVLQLARGHKPGRPVSRTLDDAHWGFIQQCWSAIEARPVAGVIVYTMKQFLGQYPTFRSLSDPFLSRSSRDGLGSEPSLSSRLATMGITHPAVDPASTEPDSFCQGDDSLGRSWAKFMEMLAGDEFDMSAVAPLELGDEILPLAPSGTSNVGCTPDAYDPKVNRHAQNHDAFEQLFSMIAAHHGDESHG
ncbi:hypothetical protein JVT61DRAFT_14307 [Boletus reticuloceps]|uniref:Uncharacterized protein n=1 Tax=Boletus reticuloceps TaxID=495285 RepID=A0A8I2YCY3_9AGAM|nr:hypothetical protein JVT61DRAFT_14307 [Boletus reticuloceps]